MTEPQHPLSGVRVLDLTDEYGAYASRLLRDLGADVVRVELGSSRPVWPGPTLLRRDGSPVDLVDRFVNAGKTVFALEDLEEGDADALLEACDVVLEREGGIELLGGDTERVPAALVRVTVSPFGTGENPGDPVDDLIVLGAGGLLHLGGYRDLGPMGAWGGQGTVAASVFAAVAALAGLFARDASPEGFTADVSAQEAIAQALEDSVAEFSLTGHARDRRGVRPREAGTGIYPCADGHVSMVAGRLGTARAWASLVEWLVESGTPGADRLSEGRWSDFDHRRSPEAIAEFGEVFGRFAADRTMESLYREAQARAIALSPVNDLPGILADRQLAARGFYREVEDEVLGGRVVFPAPPYRLSRTPPRMPAGAVSGDRDALKRFIAGEAASDG